jgi:Transglycosylase-like domain
MPLPPPTDLDKAVLALTRAMATIESGRNYSARGASGEYGAYQYMPATWSERAKKYLGDPNAPQTPDNQSFVQYSWVKEQKDAGLRPDQILAKHNSGGIDYAGKVGVNKHGVKYDVPAYVTKGMGEFQKEVKRLGGSIGGSAARPPASTPPAALSSETKKPGIIQSTVQSIAKPFLRVGLSVARVGQGVKALVLGNEETRAKTAATIGSPKDFGYFGEVAPLGFDDTGKPLSTAQGLRQSAGDASQVASFALGGVSSAKTAISLGKGATARAIAKGAAGGAASGALAQGGTALSDTTVSLPEAGKEALKGAAVGAAAGAVLSGTSAIVLGAKRIVSPDTETALIKAIKPAANNTRFREDLRVAVPEVVKIAQASQLPIKTIEDFNLVLSQAKKSVWSRYKAILTPNAKQTAPGNEIADAIESSITRRFEEQNPSASRRIRAIAKTYRREFDLEDLEERLQGANNDLASYYAKNNVGQKVAAADPEVAHTLREAEAIRNVLYSKLSSLTGKDAAALKRLWGALSNIEEASVKRANVAARQAPFSLSEQLSFASAIGDFATAAFNLEFGSAAKGAAKFAAAKVMRQANTTDNLIKTGVKKAIKLKSRN